MNPTLFNVWFDCIVLIPVVAALMLTMVAAKALITSDGYLLLHSGFYLIASLWFTYWGISIRVLIGNAR